MIALLKGILATTTADHAVIDVNGVGYLVLSSSRTLSALGAPGSSVSVQTEMQVSEDAIRLYGFATQEERDCFRLLTGVQGVGGRVALAILSVLSPAEVAQAVAREDKAMVARANGVGPKLALRIVNELKDKMGAISLGGPAAPVVRGGAAEDALSALGNLGFKPAEASRAVAGAVDELGEGATLDALVRLALKKASR